MRFWKNQGEEPQNNRVPSLGNNLAAGNGSKGNNQETKISELTQHLSWNKVYENVKVHALEHGTVTSLSY